MEPLSYEYLANKYLSPPTRERFLSNLGYPSFQGPTKAYNFVDSAFTWDRTPEGHGYWSRINTETVLEMKREVSYEEDF